MQNSQKKHPQINSVSFIDYRPAELCVKSQWLVVFYAKNPVTKLMERHRVCVPVLKSKTERIKYGKMIVLDINRKLHEGWLPYYDNADANDYKTFTYCTDKFLEIIEKDVANGTKRNDTLKSYKSGISMLKKYLADNNVKINLMLDINKPFVMNYLDWMFYTRKVSATTYNNHIVFLGLFFSFCVDRGFIKQNFAVGIPKKKKETKKRVVFTDDVKEKLKTMIIDQPEFFTLCMTTYFCFVRNTEITKLKVADINLKGNYITILGENAKNGKTQNVTIPENFKPLIENHIKDAKVDDYLFSANGFKTGKIQVGTKKIYDNWIKFKKTQQISKEFQFYSLKDTGITDLMNTGIATIKVRDQARHFDIKITETYMARNQNCDDVVRNADFNF